MWRPALWQADGPADV